ncbi:hypothetical protein QQF64_008956 [Cirrhinus molitorella]|uniref:Uncharacterized protein n=1 Tax=Cirrhinus molitorella TaxID=172907 RepID=A0ABR3MAR3_9TELE
MKKSLQLLLCSLLHPVQLCRWEWYVSLGQVPKIAGIRLRSADTDAALTAFSHLTSPAYLLMCPLFIRTVSLRKKFYFGLGNQYPSPVSESLLQVKDFHKQLLLAYKGSNNMAYRKGTANSLHPSLQATWQDP